MELVREAGEQGWLQPYRDALPEAYLRFIQIEEGVESIRTFEPQLVPGLLQTPAYARAIIRAGLLDATEDDVELRVRVRTSRQARLSGPGALTLLAIVDEAVLHRPNGGPHVMAEQLRHLLAVAEKPNVRVQVIPFAVGAHAGMTGSFSIMNYPHASDPPLVHLEGMVGDTFLETSAEVEQYRLLFDRLRAVALRPVASARLITGLLARLTGGSPRKTSNLTAG